MSPMLSRLAQTVQLSLEPILVGTTSCSATSSISKSSKISNSNHSSNTRCQQKWSKVPPPLSVNRWQIMLAQSQLFLRSKTQEVAQSTFSRTKSYITSSWPKALSRSCHRSLVNIRPLWVKCPQPLCTKITTRYLPETLIKPNWFKTRESS